MPIPEAVRQVYERGREDAETRIARAQAALSTIDARQKALDDDKARWQAELSAAQKYAADIKALTEAN